MAEGGERHHGLGEVLTAAPVEALPWPVLASALVAWLRAVSPAIWAAVVAAVALLAAGTCARTVPASALVDCVPLTVPPVVLT